MSRRSILPVRDAAALTLAAAPGVARVGVVVGFAPPAPVVEVAPPPPAPGETVWQPGYWSWERCPVCLGARRIRRGPLCSRGMVPGAWVRHRPGWVWIAGHWRR